MTHQAVEKITVCNDVFSSKNIVTFTNIKNSLDQNYSLFGESIESFTVKHIKTSVISVKRHSIQSLVLPCLNSQLIRFTHIFASQIITHQLAKESFGLIWLKRCR